MADTKISALSAATTPVTGTEVLPIVQGSVTKQVSIANLTAGRQVNVGSLLATGGYSTVTITSTTGGTKTINIGSDAYTNAFIGTATAHNLSLVANAGIVAVIGTDNYVTIANAGKGIKDSTGTTTLNFTSTGTQLAGTQQTSTGVFNNVGTAQTIAIASGQAGFIVVTGVQGGVGASSWTVPFVNRLGTTAVATSPSKAVVTADPISTVTASGANIVVTPLAANTYISYAIYYTPCAI